MKRASCYGRSVRYPARRTGALTIARSSLVNKKKGSMKNQPKIRTFAGMEVVMQFEELGRLATGDRVSAATNAAGSQIIVKGNGVHLLSTPFRSHGAACRTGRAIVAADDIRLHDGWTDLNTGNVVSHVMALFSGASATAFRDAIRLDPASVELPKINNQVHQYETCTSTGPQHLNPDPEVNVLEPSTLLNWAFALGFVTPEAR